MTGCDRIRDRRAPVVPDKVETWRVERIRQRDDVVDEVVKHASAAAKEWGATSLAKRTPVLFKFRQLLDENKERIAALITAEHGKVLSDALGEISRGQEVVEFACGIPHLLKGGYTENASTNVDIHSVHQPLGPVAIISPFNFPAMVPMWFFPIAIAAGNTVVVKPSEKDPSASIWLAELWKEAGLPDGVFNVLQGDKTAVDELLTNKAIKAISFVGSTPIAQYVYATGTAAGKAFLDMLGVFAEFETNLRRERQAEGIAAAKARGVYKGGKARINPELVRKLAAEGVRPAHIARQLNISRGTVYRFLPSSEVAGEAAQGTIG